MMSNPAGGAGCQEGNSTATPLTPEQKKAELAARFAPQASVQTQQHLIALFFCVVFVVIGLPVWWRTTGTYRASLPVAEIERLQMDQLTVAIRVFVINLDPWLELTDLATLEHQLFDDLASPINSGRHVVVHYHGAVRQASPQEMDVHRTATGFPDLEAGLKVAGTFGERADRTGLAPDTYYFLLLPNQTHLLSENNKVGLVRAAGPHVLTYLRLRKSGSESDTGPLRDTIVRLLKKVLVRDEELEETYTSVDATTTGTASSLNRTSEQRDFEDRLRQLRSSRAYEVTFTLVDPEPTQATSRQPGWDMATGVRLHLEPFLNRVTRYVGLSVRSQHLYCVDLEREGRKSHVSTGGNQSEPLYHYYREDDLAHLINPLEHYLVGVQSASHSPTVHLVVYLPPSSSHPLRLVDAGGRVVPTDAFLVPQWGGFHVFNGKERPVPVAQIMPVFVPQLKVLLGIKRRVPRIIVPLEEPDDTGVTQWELHSWLRRRTVEHLSHTSQTLTSLLHLLTRVANMVIRDEVAAEVASAVEAARLAKQHLASGSLTEAFVAGKQAFAASENAFFDPSLLELLYFQDDQKYGVYLPLFLPMGLPILLSALRAVRFFRAQQRGKVKSD